MKIKKKILALPSTSGDFKLIKEDESPKKKKEKKMHTSDLNVEELLSKDVELPMQLPVVDFSDEPSSKKNKKNRNKQSEKPTIDYVKEAQRMPEPKH